MANVWFFFSQGAKALQINFCIRTGKKSKRSFVAVPQYDWIIGSTWEREAFNLRQWLGVKWASSFLVSFPAFPASVDMLSSDSCPCGHQIWRLSYKHVSRPVSSLSSKTFQVKADSGLTDNTVGTRCFCRKWNKEEIDHHHITGVPVESLQLTWCCLNKTTQVCEEEQADQEYAKHDTTRAGLKVKGCNEMHRRVPGCLKSWAGELWWET